MENNLVGLLCSPPFILVLVAVVEQRAVDDGGVADFIAEGFRVARGGATSVVVVEVADDDGVQVDVWEGVAGVGDGVQDSDVGRGKLALILGEPGEGVKETIEGSHDGGGRFVRDVSEHIDGYDAPLIIDLN